MKVSRKGYYKWYRVVPEIRYFETDNLKTIISKIHNASRMNYARKKFYKTGLNQGILCGKNRVEKIMMSVSIYYFRLFFRGYR
jgi:putative transposase